MPLIALKEASQIVSLDKQYYKFVDALLVDDVTDVVVVVVVTTVVDVKGVW